MSIPKYALPQELADQARKLIGIVAGGRTDLLTVQVPVTMTLSNWMSVAHQAHCHSVTLGQAISHKLLACDIDDSGELCEDDNVLQENLTGEGCVQ